MRIRSGFVQNDFTVSRDWGGRHPQNDQILKRPRKSTYLILLVISWNFGEKILRDKKIMTKQLDETSNDRKFSGFGQNDFTVSRNWGGRHPQNDQILKRPRKSTYLIPPELPWNFQQKIFTTKKIRIGNMLGGSRLPPPSPLTHGWGFEL